VGNFTFSKLTFCRFTGDDVERVNDTGRTKGFGTLNNAERKILVVLLVWGRLNYQTVYVISSTEQKYFLQSYQS
jgi:hypothetical protein